MHYFFKLQFLTSIRRKVPLLLLSNHTVNLSLLIAKFVKLKLHLVELLLNNFALSLVVSDFACEGLERSSEKELAIANPASQTHPINSLNLTE